VLFPVKSDDITLKRVRKGDIALVVATLHLVLGCFDGSENRPVRVQQPPVSEKTFGSPLLKSSTWLSVRKTDALGAVPRIEASRKMSPAPRQY